MLADIWINLGSVMGRILKHTKLLLKTNTTFLFHLFWDRHLCFLSAKYSSTLKVLKKWFVSGRASKKKHSSMKLLAWSAMLKTWKICYKLKIIHFFTNSDLLCLKYPQFILLYLEYFTRVIPLVFLNTLQLRTCIVTLLKN